MADGIYGDFMGRVELLVNGTWGSVCNDAWNYPDARTACRYDVLFNISKNSVFIFLSQHSRMLGLTTVTCVAHGPTFGEGSVPVIMRAIYCRGSEDDFNECTYELAGMNESCQAGAGAVCVRLPRK